MSLSAPRTVYGIHQVTPYNITTGLPYGKAIEVLSGSQFSSSQELIELTGGSSPHPWAIGRGKITSEIALSFKEYPDYLSTLLMGKAPTVNAAEASGSVNTLTNKNGTSLVSATTGVATIGVKSGSETDIKFGSFVIKAVSPTTVDVYALSDVDFSQGTDLVFVDDTMKITATPLTITTSGVVEIPSMGLELTGGSGTIAMTADDTAVFKSRPINTGSVQVTVGANGDVFTSFGLIVYGQRQSDGEMVELDVFKVDGGGMPINFTENEFGVVEVTLKPQQKSATEGVYALEFVESSNA